MYTLRYSEEAELDITAIFNYIAQDSADRAAKYLGRMEKRILELRHFPEIGHKCKYPELQALGIRVLPFEDYLIFYTLQKAEEYVNIIRVLHGSVNYRKLF